MAEHFKLQKENGAWVPCLAEIPKKPQAIVIMIHGFESCKECRSGQLLLRRLPPAGFGVICYDQPGHGTAEARQEGLRIGACMDSLARVEAYCAERYPDLPVYYFASSYGAYLTLLYVSQRQHRGTRLFMRSAAVNMPDLFFKADPDPVMVKDLKTKGYFTPNMELGNPVKVSRGMLEDFKANDLPAVFAAADHSGMQFAMVHGEKDAVIPVEKARAFADRFHIPITVMKGQGHSIWETPEAPEKVADLAIDFYQA
ncbi:alpha/beta fold hydrolase [Pseudoramibacter sp.]|jgi:alpha-beta hydrolase superfamily lysophospholipase|uniref:alpha/beta fold hydrolase n=1 Tax=Pseudoramibacter sp. TaxID=2034862 RepID=UPI0025EC31E6|nr:alpha/beta fold hydrolase [Pseudoramibacter sp.]MCH4071837.1 lysophospholipase [Pseudoramibacter sp.]MCH4105606.1 lysophospholipase [Pseudoramibacter sp.]